MLQNFISTLFGTFARHKFTPTIQKFINETYAEFFNIDFGEFDEPQSYETLLALFTRQLRKERSLDDAFISPSDGKILYFGKGESNKAFSIKGFKYDVGELLGSAHEPNELLEGFDYAGIYLSPKDYHHFHAPCDYKLLSTAYFGGALYSVAPSWLKIIDNLYAKNERVVMKCQLANGKIFWLVFVGALNVGRIVIERENRIETNAKNANAFYNYNDEFYKKGERIGRFELGSTIVIIAQNGAINFDLSENQNIKFGKKIASFV